MIRFKLSLILFIIPLANLLAQTATLHGIVKNSENDPIEHVLISVFIEKGKTPLTTNSNSEGQYTISVPANKDLKIEISRLEYNSSDFNINLKNGSTFFQETKLEFRNKGKTVIITYEQDHVNKGEIKIEPMHYDNQLVNENAESILATLPSVSQNNELSSQYSVRGGNFDENLVYVNDIEIYRPFLVRSGQQEGLSFINPDMVENLTFSAGGFAAKYGDKLSSVLDIQYRTPDSLAGSFSASILGARFHLENKIGPRFEYIMGGRYKSNAYLLGSLDTDGEYQPRFLDYQVYTRYHVNENWNISFLGNIAENKFNMIPVSRSTNFGTFQQGINLKVYFEGQEKDEFKTYFGAITSSHLVNKTNLKFIISAFRSVESETYDIAGDYRLSDLETNYGDENFGEVTYSFGVGSLLQHSRNYLQADVMSFTHKGTHSVNDKLSILWGGKIQREEINDRLNEWVLIDSAGYSMPQYEDKIELSQVLKSQIELFSNRVMGYYQMEYTIKEDSTYLNAGIRSNYWDYNNQVIVSPRLILSHIPKLKKVDAILSLRFASGYYQQPPFYRELRNFQGQLNPELRAQTSVHFVAGLDYYFKAWGKDFKWTGDVYYKHLTNLVPYEVDNVRIRYYANNNSRGYATGIESQIHGDFVPGLDSWFSLGIMQTKEDLDGDDYFLYFSDNGDTLLAPLSSYNIVDSAIQHAGYIPRPTDQRVNVGIYFQDEMPRWPALKMHLSLLYGSRLPYGPPGTPKHLHQLRMPAYRRVDIGFSYQIVKDGMTYSHGKLIEMKEKSIFRPFHTFYIKADVFNLMAIQNTISYFWVDDIYGNQFGVPNYLTNRLVNIKVIGKF